MEDILLMQKWVLNLLIMVTSHRPKQSQLYSFWKLDVTTYSTGVQRNASHLAFCTLKIKGYTLEKNLPLCVCVCVCMCVCVCDSTVCMLGEGWVCVWRQ